MKKLDLNEMKKASKKLVGTKDFSTFRASTCRAKSPIKTIKLVKVKSLGDKIIIEFRSQSFPTTTSTFNGWLLEICWRKKMVIKKI